MSVKLNANISDQTARNFRELIRGKDISIGEGVRRATAVWKFVEDEIAAGNKLAVVEPDGTVRPVTLLDRQTAAAGDGRG